VKKILSALALLVFVSACGQSDTSVDGAAPGTDAGLHSGILLANMDTRVKPGDDFFSYVNGS